MTNQVSIGIDLGTTFSCVAYFKNDRVEIIENKNSGQRTTPSIVTFNNNERIIGKPSRISDNTIFEVKRLIGRRFNDKEVVDDCKRWPFTVIEKDSKPVIKVNYKGKEEIFIPEQISAMVLSKMKEIAHLGLAQPVVNAVITVPAYFNDSQRLATKNAGEIAGLNVLRIINEPTAAAIAYGFDKKVKNKNMLIFDLGGGTFDVSIMKIENNDYKVIAIGGDTHLGGVDFDNRLVDFFVDHFKTKYNKDISKNSRAMFRLRNECELAKKALSEALETTIEIDALHEGQDLFYTITRSLFEQINEDLFKKTIALLKETFEQSELKKEDIDDVILIGGSIRIPKIRSLLQEFFDGKELFQNINPDEAVAYGAAIQAAMLTPGNNIGFKVSDVTPLSLGIAIGKEGVMNTIIKRNTIIPCSKSDEYTTLTDYKKKQIFRVFQGEMHFVKDNIFLGEFELEGIEEALAGVPKFEVTFSIDNNGILEVKAKDKKKLVENSIVIKNPKEHLTADEIQQMIELSNEIEKHDQIRLERVKVKNKFVEFCKGNQSNQLFADALKWLETSCQDFTTEEILEKLNLLEKLKL